MSALGALEPVRLDELLQGAELLTRVDRKYVVPRTVVDAVVERAATSATVRALEIDGERAQPYASVYFDTPDLLSFRMAAHGRRRRFKLRSRTYVRQAAAFLEVKTRGARGTTVKERIELDATMPDALDDHARAYADAALAQLGLDPRPLTLVPQLETRYDRSTLLVDDARSTIDVELAWMLPGGERLSLPGLAIVETKTMGRASAIDRALWRLGHRPDRVSKYATGLAAMRPGLPSNAWRRVLRHAFAAP